MARPQPRGESGFTVLELLVAVAIVTLAACGGLAACKTVAAALTSSPWSARSSEALDLQAASFAADAASAFAIYLPAADASGRPNLGQEVDFYAKADDGGPVLWRYVYDATAQTVQRADFDLSGVSGVRDVKTGKIDPAAAYPALKGITQFRATALAADGLGDPARNPYAGIGSLFDRTPTAQRVSYDSPALNAPGAVGGNGVVQVAFGNRGATRLIHLAAGSLPTGFTLTGALLWHAVVYRVDQTHRFLGGTAGKSHVFINARVDVSYDHWSSKVAWCDFNLLGDPDGLDAHDPHADYKPAEPIEQADHILAACRRIHPQPPARDASAGAAP